MRKNQKLNPKEIFILRWAGGKRWLYPFLHVITPKKYNRYHEPFLGSGSIFFKLQPNKSFLSDINIELVNYMRIIQKSPHELYEKFSKMDFGEEAYYDVRKHKPRTELNKAAKFLYLNNFSYNGIYRTNMKGEYNVPYGSGGREKTITLDRIIKTSSLLKNSNIKAVSFQKTLRNIKEGDFVFIDPPYTNKLNKKAEMYTYDALLWDELYLLIDFVKEVKSKGAYFVLTFQSNKESKKLFFSLGKILNLDRIQAIGGKNAKRDSYKEIIITNIK